MRRLPAERSVEGSSLVDTVEKAQAALKARWA